jgi:hypothetical protein
MILHYTPPSPSSPVVKLGWLYTGRLRKRDYLLKGVGGGGFGVGGCKIIRQRESLDLYKLSILSGICHAKKWHGFAI